MTSNNDNERVIQEAVEWIRYDRGHVDEYDDLDLELKNIVISY